MIAWPMNVYNITCNMCYLQSSVSCWIFSVITGLKYSIPARICKTLKKEANNIYTHAYILSPANGRSLLIDMNIWNTYL